MNVSLTRELQKFVEQRVKTGMYETASEVVREGLRLLKERDDERRRHLQALRAEIALGLGQADSRRTRPLDSRTFERIRQNGRSRFAVRGNGRPAQKRR